MAFHPMRTFQKNRKFWMASVLLICMVTFVLCTGVGGDLSDTLIRWFTGRRGYKVTDIDGRAVYSEDLRELKNRRDIANEYMRKAAQLTLLNVNRAFEQAGKEKNERKRLQTLHLLSILQRDLADKAAKPRYFGGGTKLEDLLDFIIWRNQADRLGVRLTDDSIRELVASEVNAQLQQYTQWGPEAASYVQREVRGGFFNATYRVIVDALTDEFRVRIAQLMLQDSPAQSIELQAIPGMAGLNIERPLEARMPLSPEQIYENYRKNRSEAEVALVPVRVAAFLNEVPTPDLTELKRFFEKYRTRRFNPASEEPGFQAPEQVQAQWVSANAKSKFYTAAARAATTLETTPPLLYAPLQSPFVTAASYAARRPAWVASLARNYESYQRQHNFRERYLMATRATPYFALPLLKGVEEPKSPAAAALFGATADPTFALSGIAGYQASAYFPQAAEIAPILEHERARRAPLGATMVLSGAQSPFMAAALETYAARPQFLPLLGEVKKEMRAKVEAAIAEEWAKANMQEVKARLEANKGPFALEPTLRKLRREPPFRDGLEVMETDGWRSPYDIGDDPNMAPLKKSYEKWYDIVNQIEGRAGTAGMLKADDFQRLFFSAEPFAVGNAQPFDPKPWPPTVTRKLSPQELLLKGKDARAETIVLFDRAERPFLFWKTTYRPSQPPPEDAIVSDPAVRKEVEDAWRLAKARAKILPHLQQVADAVVQAEKAPNPDVWAAVRALAKKQGEALLVLKQVAPLVAKRVQDISGPTVVYTPYELPPYKIAYPRDDTAKQILALRDLKEPIKINDKNLDELNKALFKATRDRGKVVQVLANKPKTVFYVAVLVTPPTPSENRFYMAYREATGIAPKDQFVTYSQNEAARDYRRDLMVQLRAAAKMSDIAREAVKEFGEEAVNR